MKIKTKIKISVACVWIGAVLALLSKNLGNWSLWAGLGIVIAAAVYRYTMISCPYCGHKLLDGKTAPSKCPNCGESLE